MTSFECMETAAKSAIAYRRACLDAPRRPIEPYPVIYESFAEPLPEQSEELSALLEQLASKAAPGLRTATGPHFFGWVIGGSHPAGVAADWLTSAWGQNAGNIEVAPAAAAVEQVVSGWLLELLDLPRSSSVGFVTGATLASFTALAAARGEVLRQQGWDVEADGLFGAPPIRVLIGADAHVTISSALRYLGLGAKRVLVVETDTLGRMDPSALGRALSSGCEPTIVITQAGQINTGASDPFEAICPVAADHNAWVHVDGAFGLWARSSDRLRSLLAGVEQADSWSVDGHKWLQLPYDSGFAIVRHEAAHRRAMNVTASYLPVGGEEQREPSAYVPELSRRARGFAVWALIKALGRSGVADLVERHCAIAAEIGDRLSRASGIELVAPVILNQLMLRFGASDDGTLAVVQRLREEGLVTAGPALWRGQWVLRMSVCSWETTAESAETSCAAIEDAWQVVCSSRLAA